MPVWVHGRGLFTRIVQELAAMGRSYRNPCKEKAGWDWLLKSSPAGFSELSGFWWAGASGVAPLQPSAFSTLPASLLHRRKTPRLPAHPVRCAAAVAIGRRRGDQRSAFMYCRNGSSSSSTITLCPSSNDFRYASRLRQKL